MNSTEAIGRVQITLGNTNIIDTKGIFREVSDADLIYHNEQLCSDDSETLLQVKYEGLSESTTYHGIFSVLVDDSVLSESNGHENLFRDDFYFIAPESSEELLSSSTILDLSNVNELTSTQVLDFSNEKVLDSIIELNLLKDSNDLEIVYEGDYSNINSDYHSSEQVHNIVNIVESQVDFDSTLLVDIPTIIDDILSDS